MQRPFPIREEDHGLAPPLWIAADHLIRQGCDRAGARDYAAFLGFFFLEPS